MKTFYLTGAIVMTSVILILAFENIQATCNYMTFFFYEVSAQTPPTMTILFEAVLGIIAGIFYTQLAHAWMKPAEDEEDDY